jgi:hypothetical protein
MKLAASASILAAGLVALAQPAPKPLDADAARACNDEAFARYLACKENLVAAHAGEWLAITGGKIVPTDARTFRPAPLKSFEECVKAAEAASPSTAQRYLFRVGEEGDVRYDMSSGLSDNVIGLGLLDRLGVGAWSFVDHTVTWQVGDKSQRFAGDTDEGLRIDLDVGDPAKAIELRLRVVDSSGFNGIAVLEPDLATKLGLERFEIPGAARIDFGSHRVECRRARIRVRLPDVGVDELVPIAIWPR